MPIVGGLFRHEDSIQTNNELLAFITPYVIDDDSTQEAIRQIEEPKLRMQDIVEELNRTFEVETYELDAIEPQAKEEEELSETVNSE